MKDISVIIPLHEYNEEIKTLLQRAIKSVPTVYEVRISCKYGLSKELEKLECSSNVVIMESNENETKSDFCTLVNQAVGDTKYFSILEFDDEYTEIWFKNVEKYIDYKPETSVFVPLVDVYDFYKNQFIGYGNEAPWASSFSNQIGVIDFDCLQDFFDFYMCGSVFNTEDWINSGGLKSSIKVSFWYEFLLRLTNNGKEVFVLPKVGYKHYVNRTNSLYDIYHNTVDEAESKWWFETAKKEAYFKEDRNKTYQKNNDKGE